MRTPIKLAAAILALTPMFAFCAVMNPANDSPGLNDTAWTLTGLPGHALLPGRQLTMQFAGGQVQGTDGCNRYGAPYISEAGSFHLSGNIVSTKMACPEPVMQQADAFLGALAKTRAIRIDEGQLVLLDTSGLVLATMAAQVRELPGTAWRITGYNNGRQAVVSVHAGSMLTMEFTADGRISGSAGCNHYTAAYSATGEQIEIGKVAATRKMCARPQGVMEQEAAFSKALEKAAVLRIDGDRLELRSAQGARMVTATRNSNAAASPHSTDVENATVTGAEASTQSIIDAHGLRLPASFRGDFPCADCDAIRHHLDLWPDQVFHLRRQWLGKGLVRDEIGRWRVDAIRKALILYGGAEMVPQYEIKGPDRLRQLDIKRQPIQSKLSYELVSDGRLTPTDLSLPLAGEMQYMADAARFTECLSGHSYPIVMEADFVNMERAYLQAVKEPGALLYVTFDGSIVPRPRVDAEGLEPSVIVRRFINAWPHEKCERAMANASLTNTYWRIVRLGGNPVSTTQGRREPHLLLRDQGRRSGYAATIGCNQLLGSYTVGVEAIGFKSAASTLMACPPPLDALEKRLGEALAKARRWRINANTLEFFDATGAAVALFEAVYL